MIPFGLPGRGVLRHAPLGAKLSALPVPSLAHACACGCGVFEVGMPGVVPTHSGGMLTFEYDFVDPNDHWNGAASAPGVDSADRQIRTHVVTAGVHDAFDRAWAVSVAVPDGGRPTRRCGA